MKFVFFGYDFSLNTAERLVNDGHECLAVFSFACDQVFNFNTDTRSFAKIMGIPFVENAVTHADISSWTDAGTDIFLTAGYPYKIPVPDESKARAINLHPSFLPLGRGLMPTPHIIMNHPEAGGITVHKLTSAFDQGDILFQERLHIHPAETVETYSSRVALHSPDIVSRILKDFDTYWDNASPQIESQALHFPATVDEMRFIDWSYPVEKIERIGRAFGGFGSLCRFDDRNWAVFNFDVWKESHPHDPGTLVRRTPREIIIAAKDGFVCLKHVQKLG